MTNIIEVENLTRTYGKVRAVDGVSFAVEENGIYGLLGRNGAGKTTLMQLLTAQDFATRGTIRVFGASPVENATVLSKVCFVKESQAYPDSFKAKHVFKAAPHFFSRWDAGFAMRLADAFRLPPDRPSPPWLLPSSWPLSLPLEASRDRHRQLTRYSTQSAMNRLVSPDTFSMMAPRMTYPELL